MGNDNSKWTDLSKKEQIVAVKEYAKSIQGACGELLARIEAGDVEEIFEPKYMISRGFTSGSNYDKPEFSFKVSLAFNGLATKEVSGNEFWPKTVESEDNVEIDKEKEVEKENEVEKETVSEKVDMVTSEHSD